MCSSTPTLHLSSPGSIARTLNFCRLSVWLVVSSLLIASASQAKPATRVFLNGTESTVYFNDGDSFQVLEGPLRGTKARLSGFNTLESFGPAHRWGTWDPHELYTIAKEAALNARRGTWHCNSDMAKDGYGRILWHCEDLILDDIRKGLAHAMTVTAEPAPAKQLELQKLAQAEKLGMWAKGIPPFILTSLHSADEGAGAETYNRLISTADGHTEKWKHQDDYKDCQWVCHPSGACMLYVGFQRRYGANQAECLKP